MNDLQSKDTTRERVNGSVDLQLEQVQGCEGEETLNVGQAINLLPRFPLYMQPPAFAFLIDADNTSVESFPEMINKAETLGILTLRRAYGNQQTLFGQKWKDLCLHYALQPMIHLGISGVKNATDIALVVDAMDLFHTQAIRRFCLVTGDQDFTALVLRLRSYGCQVYGIGKPSKALATVCNAFFPLGDLREPRSVGREIQDTAATTAKKAQEKAPPSAKQITAPFTANDNPAKKSFDDPDLTHLLTQAMTEVMQETSLEWILASRLGARIKQLDPQFEAKTYGQKNFPLLCKARPDIFEWRPKGTHLEIRLNATPIPE